MVTRTWLLRNLQSMTKLNLSGVAAVVDLKYSHLSNSGDSVLICGDNGLVILLKSGLVSPGNTTYTENLGTHNNIVFHVEWVDDSSFLTASADKTVCLWCMKSGSFAKKSAFLKHSSGVKTLSVSPDDTNVFVSGGRDGNIFVWDCRCNSVIQRGVKFYNKPMLSLIKAHEMVENCAPLKKKNKVVSNFQAVESLNGVTCVKWISGRRLLSTAAADSSVLMWDIRKAGTSSSSKPSNVQTFLYGGCSRKRIGYSNLAVSPHEDFFAVSCTDNNIYEFNLLPCTDSPVSNVYPNPGGSSYFTKIDLDPSGSFLLSGSCDNKAFVFCRGYSEPIAEMKSAHKEEVPCVSWHKFDPSYILTACEEGIVSLWTDDFSLRANERSQKVHSSDFEVTGSIKTNFLHFPMSNVSDDIQRRKTGVLIVRPTVGKNEREQGKTVFSNKSDDASSSFASPPTDVVSQGHPLCPSSTSRGAAVVCEELKDLPDYVKTPRHHMMSPPPPLQSSTSSSCRVTPATCPSSRVRTTDDWTVTPEKSQFMANFRSAFKPTSASKKSPSPASSPATLGKGKTARRHLKTSKRSPVSSQVTPLKSNNSIVNALSPIAEFFRSSSQVKRKLDQL